MKVEELVRKLQLTEHPEGGYFGEIYRSTEEIDAGHFSDRYIGKRNLATSIYYLLGGNDFSAFHKLATDEIWHFYLGSPMLIHELTHESGMITTVLGTDFMLDQNPQYVVRSGQWFAAEPMDKKGYSLVGCTMAPGFDFQDFEMADQKSLTEEFAEYEQEIKRLTRTK
jgi:predicted cupin superfamily sugar epimerase